VLEGPAVDDPGDGLAEGEAEGDALGEGEGEGVGAAVGATEKSNPPRVSPSSVIVVARSVGPAGSKPSGGVSAIS